MSEAGGRGIEDFYPLSHMQQGILFHSLLSPGSGMYLDQTSYFLLGKVDPLAFERAWQFVVGRNPIFRTGFVWDGVKEPVQVVRLEASLPFEHLDWRDSSESALSRRREIFLQQDRERGFGRNPDHQVATVEVLASQTPGFVAKYESDAIQASRLKDRNCVSRFHYGEVPAPSSRG